MNGECRYHDCLSGGVHPSAVSPLVATSHSGAHSQRATRRFLSTPGAVPTTNNQTNPISPNSGEINCGARILACRVAIGGDIDSRSGARSQRAASRLISTPGAVGYPCLSNLQNTKPETNIGAASSDLAPRPPFPLFSHALFTLRSQASPTENDETNPISPNSHAKNDFPANGNRAPTAMRGPKWPPSAAGPASEPTCPPCRLARFGYPSCSNSERVCSAMGS